MTPVTTDGCGQIIVIALGVAFGLMLFALCG